MSVTIKGRVPVRSDGQFTASEAAHIAERLISLEKAVSGGFEKFSSPSAPSSGPGSGGTVVVVAPGGGGGGGGTPVADHGSLTGLADDDHPQYAKTTNAMHPVAHLHTAQEIVGLEQPPKAPLPHRHNAGDVQGIEQPPRAPLSHRHNVEDISGLEPEPHRFQAAPEIDYWTAVMFSKVFGG
jgi:hypothetical protein